MSCQLSPGCQGCQNCQALPGAVRCCQGHCHMTVTAAVKLLSGCCQAAVRAVRLDHPRRDRGNLGNTNG
eukprot:3795562-Prymnesium_polylepis.1